MTLESKRRFIINTLYFGIIFFLVYFLTKYILIDLMPFILGAVIALLIRPLILKLHQWLKINQKVLAVITLLSFYVIVGLVLALLTTILIKNLEGFFRAFPAIFENDIIPAIEYLLERFEQLFSNYDVNISDLFAEFNQEIISTLSSVVKSMSSFALINLTSFFASIPGIFISFLLTIISSFFITLDFDKIVSFTSKQITPRAKEIINAIRNIFKNTLGRIFKAYAMIMTLTFVELALGLSVLKIPHALTAALLIAMIDILPVLGTGGVMLPWVVIELINGSTSKALGLFVIYFIITIVRNIIEPKIVGDQIGLYPLLTLIAMFLGLKIFGIIGLFGLPIALTILVKLHQTGVLRWLKDD